MSQDAKAEPAQPVLNAETFQRLLTAAYMLQVHHDRRLSVQSIGPTKASPPAAESVLQHRISAVMIAGQDLHAGQPDTAFSGEAAKKHVYSVWLEPSIEPKVARNVHILSKNALSWKMAEPLAIAIVFCVMMALSIHRLSAHPGNVSLATGTLESRNVSQPARLAEGVSATDRQTLTRRNSLQPGERKEANIIADFIAKDTTIHYLNRSIGLHAGAADEPRAMQAAHLVSAENTISSPRVGFPSRRAAGRITADAVVQYGPDVTTWLTKPKGSVD